MNRRMPVVATVERRRELSRRRDVRVRVQVVRDLVRILLVHARERETRKPISSASVELGALSGSVHREKEKNRSDHARHAPESIAASAAIRHSLRPVLRQPHDDVSDEHDGEKSDHDPRDCTVTRGRRRDILNDHFSLDTVVVWISHAQRSQQQECH